MKKQLLFVASITALAYGISLYGMEMPKSEDIIIFNNQDDAVILPLLGIGNLPNQYELGELVGPKTVSKQYGLARGITFDSRFGQYTLRKKANFLEVQLHPWKPDIQPLKTQIAPLKPVMLLRVGNDGSVS
jgi:hypothetical protein